MKRVLSRLVFMIVAVMVVILSVSGHANTSEGEPVLADVSLEASDAAVLCTGPPDFEETGIQFVSDAQSMGFRVAQREKLRRL